ncbi:serine-rich adhesin for platelets-like [Littorina saxatilis]|uniref:BZIP domain-containing protein n=1 Tax=Littorina saxatilis TaxID=31220 RepID=A0AAN9BXJ1_9CAEN
MCSTSTSLCDGRKMGAQTRPGLRQQLKAKVSDNLTSRGIGTDQDRWSTKPKAKLTGAELERLNRQRANKRKWAQKERAKCKKEMDELKVKNAHLEHDNGTLKKDVERLKTIKVRMESVLIDHECKINSHAPPLMKYVFVPSTHKWTDVKNGETISIAVGQDGILRHAERSEPSRKTHRLRLTSAGEEENLRATAKAASEFQKIEGTNIVVHNGRYYQLNPLPQPVLATPKPTMSVNGKVGLSEIESVSVGSEWLAGASFGKILGDEEVELDSEPCEKTEGQTLSSGGFSLDSMTASSKSFMEMLREDDEDKDLMIVQDTLRIKMEPPEVMEEVEIGSTMEVEDARYSQGIVLHDAASASESSASDVIAASFSDGSQSDKSQSRPEASSKEYWTIPDDSDSGSFSDTTAYKTVSAKDGLPFNGKTSGKLSKKSFLNPWAVAQGGEKDQAGIWRPSESAMAEFHTINDTNSTDQITTNTSATTSSDAASPARFTTLTNMEIPSSAVDLSDSITIDCSTVTMEDLSACDITEVTVNTEPDAEFKLPGTRRAKLTRMTSWQGGSEPENPVRRTRRTSFPTADFRNVDRKARVEEAMDEDSGDDIVENAIAANFNAASLSKAKEEASTDGEATSARRSSTRASSKDSSTSLVAPEEMPSSPSTPTSPAPTSLFRTSTATDGHIKGWKDCSQQQLLVVQDGGEQRLIIQNGDRWEVM